MFSKATLMSAIVMLTITNTEGKAAMKYEVQVQQVPAQLALVVKGKVAVEKAGDAIGGSIGAVSAFLTAAHVSPTGAPFTRTYSFENGVLEFESGFPIAAPTKGNGKVIATELPKTQVATTLHVGTQATSEDAYKAIHTWMAANSKQPAGAPWEVYINDTTMQVFFPIR